LRRSRSLLPSECWHTLNPLYLRLAALDPAAPPAELREALEGVLASNRELAGHVTAGMLRDAGYAFLRMGTHVERADMMLRVATIVADTLIPPGHGTPFEDVRWMGLLKSVGAYGTYRHRYHAATGFRSALELLLYERTFPRSLAHAIQEIERDLAGLPGNADAAAAFAACRPTRAVETRSALARFADEVLARISQASAVLERTYFSSAPPSPEDGRARHVAHKRHAPAVETRAIGEHQKRRGADA
jgi:uncharacterized alpha-E superfamily protein